MKIKNLILCLAFIAGLGLHQANGQLNVSYHFSDFGQESGLSDFGQKFGIGYTLKNIVEFDAYLYGAKYFDNVSPEFTVRVNIIRKDAFKIYLGTGVITNRAYSLVFPVGAKVTPFASAPKFSIKFDLELIKGLDGGGPDRIIPGLGISYAFW